MHYLFAFLIRWFSRYQLLAFAWLFAILVICFESVAGLGLPALFWCRTWYGNLAIGVAVACFFALCSFVGFLLDHNHPKVGLPASAAGMQQYFRRTFWFATVAVIGRGICRQFFDDERCGKEWVVVLGYLGGMLLVRYAAPQLDRLATPLSQRPWFQSLVDWLASVGNQQPPQDLWLHAYAFLLVTILGTAYALIAGFAARLLINAGVSICIILGLIVLAYGALRFFVPRALLLAVIALVAWIFGANQVPWKHRYHDLRKIEPVSLAKYAPRANEPDNKELISDDLALQAWRIRVSKCAAKPPLVIVMTSGGGIRAAVWTAAVLEQLHRIESPCPLRDHIRVITGASGGMVGAGYYVAARATGKDLDPNLVARDSLDEVAKYLVLRDLPGQLAPWRYRDRGWALEEAWKANAKPMRLAFDALRPVEKNAKVPSLIYSPSSLDDGRRLLVSNLQLAPLTHHRGLSSSAIQFYELYPRAQISMATVARMSASFPWVSPASELPTEELRRIGDAGYVDNYGGFVASAWIEKNRVWLRKNVSGILVVQIRDSTFGHARRNVAAVPLDKHGQPKSTRVSRGFSEIIAPVQGVMSTRGPAMNFRSDFDLVSLFADDFLTSLEVELPNDTAPLTWNLTDKTAAKIIAEAPHETAEVRRWWTARAMKGAP